MLRFRVSTPDGRRIENNVPVGSVRDFPKQRDVWREVDRRGLLVAVNADNGVGRVHFAELAEFYLTVDFGRDAVRQKSANTIPIVKHYVRDYLVARWGNEFADDIKPIDLQRWLLSLQNDKGLAWTTISKIRGIMRRVYVIGIRHERVTKNPVDHVETKSKSPYKAITITPVQTLAILNALASDPLHYTLVLVCAATALRSSEILYLRWSDILWEEGRIRVSKRWAKGEDGDTKTITSDGYVPMHPVLAGFLREWHAQTPHAAAKDFLFPSLKKFGRAPLSACAFVADHLRPTAIGAGVQIARGQRFGLHNLRHSLSNWLVNKGKVDPKTVQGLLRHAKIQTTLDLYTQEDAEKTRAAQGAFLAAVGLENTMVH